MFEALFHVIALEPARAPELLYCTFVVAPPAVPDGVAHVPSPRKNVEADAPTPPARLLTDKLPVMQAPVARFTVCDVAFPDSAQPGEK
jgi:hypothetical protein